MTGRIAVGLIIGVAVIGSLLSGKWWTSMLFGFISIMCLSEYMTLSELILNKKKAAKKIVYIAFGTLLYLILIFGLYYGGSAVELNKSFLPSLILLSCSYFLLRILGLYVMWPHSRLKEFLDVMMYIPVPLALCAWICTSTGSFVSNILLGVLLLVWAGDIGAFYVGRKIGRTKLFERHSPKKSWEGALGGLVFCLVSAVLISKLNYDLSLQEWLILAIIIWASGIYGDLIESHFKRVAGVKDSGNTLGDHGGFLDRFDGFLCVIPFASLYLYLIQ